MRKSKLLLALTTIGFAGSALATNGMNMNGYGPVASAMGGASMAYENGTAGMMNNPATLGLMDTGSRLDVAVGFLGPDVGLNGMTFTGAPWSAPSGGDAYYMPAIGWAKNNGSLTYGVGMFAQGGMGTEYGGATMMSAGTGVDSRSEVGVGRLMAPLAMRVNDKLTIGGSMDFIWGGMDMKLAMPVAINTATGAPAASMGGAGIYTGAGTFMDFLGGQVLGSATPSAGMGAALTGMIGGGANALRIDFSNSNKFTGEAKTTGWGGKLGFAYQISPDVKIGGTYHMKTHLGDWDTSRAVMSGYNGAAQMGTMTGKMSIKDFQWPEVFGLGIAVNPNDRWLLAADYKRINWNDVMKNFTMMFTTDGGGTAGLPAGETVAIVFKQNWEAQNVLSLGAQYKATNSLSLRFGASLANNPIPDAYVHPLFPAIEKNHLTAGFGYEFDQSSMLNFSLEHALKASQTSSNTGVTVDHSQTNWQLMYTKRF